MELKPCPFCGYENVKVQKKEKGYQWLESLVSEIRVEKATYYVVCNRCKARGSPATGRFVGYVRTAEFLGPFDEVKKEVPLPDYVESRDDVRQKAIALWNRRPDE